MILVCTCCDPVSSMEANILNATSESLTLDFISSDEDLRKTLEVLPDQSALFQEGFDIGGIFLEPSLVDYDSVVIKNQAEVILKIYKENDSGKNIYRIEEYWTATEPSKRVYIYEYEIVNEDIE